MPVSLRGGRLPYGVRLSALPGFTPAAREPLLGGTNFIHGSSVYRPSAFDQVGGYGTRAEDAEDKHLFQRMIDSGYLAVKNGDAPLEYRQHSGDQANMQFSSSRVDP